MTGALHTASAREVEALLPALAAARLFDSAEPVLAWRGLDAWRVQVSDRGEVVLLERWREHLDLLQMRGIRCQTHRLGDLLAELRVIAADHGFAGLLSPLLPESAAGAYISNGMRVTQRLVAFCAPPRAVKDSTAPAGVTLREACDGDISAVSSLDEAVFEPFWRYGHAKLSRGIGSGDMIVADSEREVVGYTLTTVSRGVGSLACLAVHPDARRCGVGRSLLSAAASRAARMGATSLSLCTQESNRASRALYASAGLPEVPDAFVMLKMETADASADESGSVRIGARDTDREGTLS